MLHIFNKKFNLEDIIFSNFISNNFIQNIFNEKNTNQNETLEKKMGNGKLKNAIIAGLTLLSVANPFATLTSKAHSFDIKAHNQAVEAEKEKTRQIIKKWKIKVIPEFEKDIADNLPFYKENIDDHNNMLTLFKENLDIHHQIFTTYSILLSDKIRIEKERKRRFKGYDINLTQIVKESFRRIEIKTLKDTQALANLLILMTNIYRSNEAHGYYYDLNKIFSNGKLNAKNSPYLFQRVIEIGGNISIINQNIKNGYLRPDKKPVQYFRAMMEISPNNRNKINMPPQIYQDFSKLALLAGLTNNPEHISYFINKDFLKNKKFMESIDEIMANNHALYSNKDRIEVSETISIRGLFNSMIKKNIPFADQTLVKKATNELKRKHDIIDNYLARRIYAKTNF